MVSENKSGAYDDVNEDNYIGKAITVGISQIEAKVGSNRLSGRQELLIFNHSKKTIYFGPTSVSVSGANRGIPIFSKEMARVPAGEDIAVFLIASSASLEITIQEMS